MLSMVTILSNIFAAYLFIGFLWSVCIAVPLHIKFYGGDAGKVAITFLVNVLAWWVAMFLAYKSYKDFDYNDKE